MKEYIKLGFGLAIGTCLFKMCTKVGDDTFERKFNKDIDFQLLIKRICPTLYERYSK